MYKFDAPGIIENIPDIATIYETNDEQADELDDAIETLDDNIFLDDMHEDQIVRWENILKISPATDDSWDDRRFRVKTKVLERLPYSYRVIINKLETLVPDGLEISVDADRLHLDISLALRSAKMLADVGEMLEKMLPLNMTYTIIILYNQYSIYINRWTHGQMHAYTHEQLRSNIWN
jgi:hypothetical protein